MCWQKGEIFQIDAAFPISRKEVTARPCRINLLFCPTPSLDKFTYRLRHFTCDFRTDEGAFYISSLYFHSENRFDILCILYIMLPKLINLLPNLRSSMEIFFFHTTPIV